MSDQKLKEPELVEEACDSHVGRRCMFVMAGQPRDHDYNFSSTLNGIGIYWDVNIKNYTEVIVLSDPVEIISSYHGRKLMVSRVMASEMAWVQTCCLMPIDDIKS